jgi:hypothetical protein
MVFIPLWLIPYMLLLGGGYGAGEAVGVPTVGLVLGLAASILYGVWRWNARANAEADAYHDWENRLAEAVRRERLADPEKWEKRLAEAARRRPSE